MEGLFIAWLEGFAVGLGMVLLVGPVFFTLLYSSLHYGFRAGASVAAGIALSDLLVAGLLLVFGLDNFFQKQFERSEVHMAAALLLIGLGVWYGLKKGDPPPEKTFTARRMGAFVLKGFSVNFINPFVFVAWISILGHGSLRLNGKGLTLYVAGALMGIFATDLLKVAVAKQIRRFFSPEFLRWVYRVIALLLISSGIVILFVS